jgi:hypothetical protein
LFGSVRLRSRSFGCSVLRSSFAPFFAFRVLDLFPFIVDCSGGYVTVVVVVVVVVVIDYRCRVVYVPIVVDTFVGNYLVCYLLNC